MGIERQVAKPEAPEGIGDDHAKSVREHPHVVAGGACPADELDEAVAHTRACAHQLQHLVRGGTNGCKLRLHGLLNAHPARDDVGGQAIPDGTVAKPVDDQMQRVVLRDRAVEIDGD